MPDNKELQEINMKIYELIMKNDNYDKAEFIYYFIKDYIEE